jgi:hypothetical protein
VKFTVVWKRNAENELAAIWLSEPSEGRRRVVNAARLVDRTLRFNPETVGESRSERRRVEFFGPLLVTFEVREPDRIVLVLSVHRVPDSE